MFRLARGPESGVILFNNNLRDKHHAERGRAANRNELEHSWGLTLLLLWIIRPARPCPVTPERTC